jgi:hypothetical protein
MAEDNRSLVALPLFPVGGERYQGTVPKMPPATAPQQRTAGPRPIEQPPV